MPTGNNAIPNIKPLTDTKPGVRERTSLKDSFNQTNLDLENKSPLGGPINTDPVTINGVEYGGFTTKYSSTEPYMQEGNQKSALVSVDQGGDVTDLGTLKVTALDVASNEAGVKQGATGGPNRIAPNQFNTVGSDGTYQLTQYPSTRNNLTPLPSNGTPLKDLEGKDIPNQELQSYSSTNTYLDSVVKFKDENNNKI
jgi:hypothetical protein|tara:strand:+ start:3351 stop:3941 length:591 start_codon:yes stop_codon:yes gene_type:complete